MHVLDPAMHYTIMLKTNIELSLKYLYFALLSTVKAVENQTFYGTQSTHST